MAPAPSSATALDSVRIRRSAIRANRLFIFAALLVSAYGGLLRFEALVGNYGWMGQPRWARVAEQYAVPIARALRPDTIVWGPIADPYVGGDPINYLQYAREMRHFYQAHVREPVFLAVTRAFLWLSDGRDIALSYASAAGGTLAVFATCLLGAIVWSRAVGLAAGLALAAEFEAVAWSVGGWRDDTFMMCVTFAAASLVWLLQRPSASVSTFAGFSMAAACLTRISALSFVAPALLWIAMFAPHDRRADVRKAAATAGLIATILVAPYLVNCWRATGDPLYALNYHTRYYRSAEGKTLDESVSALDYVSDKLATKPVTTLDTAAQGLTIVPFRNKWQGWTAWNRAIGPVLQWLGALGMLAAVWSPSGRLLLVILVTSLIPYALTWSVGGGGEWRFTQHVYPMYLVCAFQAAAILLRAAATTVGKDFQGISISRRDVMGAASIAGMVGLAWFAYWVAPILIAREAIAVDGEVTIMAGPRDRWFFTGAWSAPIYDGTNVTVRVAQAELTAIRLPLEKGDYTMTLRLDPPVTTVPAPHPELRVFLNRMPLMEIDLTRDPRRMGTYRMRVPSDRVSRWNRLDLLASRTVRAGDSGAPFRSLPSDSHVAFRLWYVRVVKNK